MSFRWCSGSEECSRILYNNFGSLIRLQLELKTVAEHRVLVVVL